MTPQARTVEFRTAIKALVEEYAPTSVRHIYYAAVGLGLVPKTNPGAQRIGRNLVAMRRDGWIAYSDIVDHGRRGHFTYSRTGGEGALYALAQQFRRSLWDDNLYVVEVWCEAKATAGVIQQTCWDADVTLYPTGGQASDSFVWQAAQEHLDDHRQLVVLYVGDHDPAGLECEHQLRTKLEGFHGREIVWQRIGVTEYDAERLQDLGTAPKKRSWSRAGRDIPFHGLAVEAEAINPNEMRVRLDAEIRRHIDGDRVAELLVEEARIREVFAHIGRDVEDNGIEWVDRTLGWSVLGN